jgi:phenylacetate-CoA ligase
MRDPRSEHWNPELETMAPDRLRALEAERLRRQLAYTWDRSRFYRTKWRAAGADPRRVSDAADLPLLPFTEKREFQESQEVDPPFGANQAAPLDALVRMQATGGTTGRPLRLSMTRADVDVYNEIGARAAWCAGLRPGDVLFECMNYSLYAGGVSDHMTFETVGACVAPVGVGQSKRLLEILKDMRMEVALWSTPSYALHLADVARGEGLDPVALGIRKGFFSGDAGLAVPGYRARIESALGLVARDLWGMGELGAPGAECRNVAGLHWLGQGHVLAEFIDPDTAQPIPMADGATGELVFTTITREAHPLVRFRSHDHVRVWTGGCACGRQGFRFRVLGRSDDMFIVKGINVFPLGVQDVVAQFVPELSGEFQIVLEEPPPITRDPALRVEAGAGLAPDGFAAVADRLERRIREVLVFTAAVTVLPWGSMPRTERKAKRLFRAWLGERP